MFIPFLAAITRVIILFLPAISATLSFFALRSALERSIYGSQELSAELQQKIHALFDAYAMPQLKLLSLKKMDPGYAPFFMKQGKPMITHTHSILLNEEFLMSLPADEFDAIILQTIAYYTHNISRMWVITSWVIQAVCGLISYLIVYYLYTCASMPTLCAVIRFPFYWNIVALFVGPMIHAAYFAYDNTRFSFNLARQAQNIQGYIQLYTRLYEITQLPLFLKKITYFKKHE